MFLPPVLRPLAAVGPANAAVQQIAEAPFSVVRGAPGSYVAERLAGVIDGWERLQDCVWLRARDPRSAELAQSLAAACRHRWSSGVGAAPPSPLGEEIRQAPPGAVIVIELGGRVTAGVTRLVRAIRPASGPATRFVRGAHRRRGGHVVVRPAGHQRAALPALPAAVRMLPG